ncbi:hypothetical protein TI39_contig272g00018 [Zymoseptoria brevis]|uniref:Uncharacterized protein n=1 Tax=Zymoseptoria brevis TaxID=1047168 RepID=A0A0F4GXC6_9PEZI|nr:hypothetical protein TI39_contig272g00018 [Zymoseptoria brevis]
MQIKVLIATVSAVMAAADPIAMVTLSHPATAVSSPSTLDAAATTSANMASPELRWPTRTAWFLRTGQLKV